MLPKSPSRIVLEKLLEMAGPAPDPAETAAVFQSMLRGELTETEVSALLVAWRFRGETGVELAAGGAAMRAHAVRVALPAGVRPLADNCGTGGDGAGSFNLSTAAAIVASAAGVRVAKHGNRSVSSQCGSADLLFAAGFPETLSHEGTVALLAETGFTFFFAPQFHPALKHVMPVRKTLGVRTVFNLLGPLANPIAPEFQIIGVGAKTCLRPMAEALAGLGVTRGLVVHSRDGMDELSAVALTDAISIDGGQLAETVFDPAALGLKAAAVDIKGGDPATNLGILRELLAGEPRRAGLADAIALNAGALMWVAGAAPSLAAGLATARGVIASKKAEEHFARWIAAAQRLAGTI